MVIFGQMYNRFNIKISVTKYIFMILILSQLSNTFLLTDFLVNEDKIAYTNGDVDQNNKEDKNSFDNEEETKILEGFFHVIGYSVELNSFNYLLQNLSDELNHKDFPPPELFLLSYTLVSGVVFVILTFLIYKKFNQ